MDSGVRPCAGIRLKLLIISSMPHHVATDGSFVGWAATVEEIDHLATLFESVRHVAAVHPGTPPPTAAPYTSPNVKVVPQVAAGGSGLRSKLRVAARAPLYAGTVIREAREADVIHVRAPANIPLIGLPAMRLARIKKPTWVKYAGNWNADANVATSYALQRWWLTRDFHQGVVTINGASTKPLPHVEDFFNPSFDRTELTRMQASVESKSLAEPYRLLFVGRAETAKGIWRVIEIARRLSMRGVPYLLDIVGDGEERASAETQVQKEALGKSVRFHGWLPKRDIEPFYEAAHFVLLPSSSEGWPKVLSEGMAYGALPIASAVGSIPETIRKAGSGAALSVADIDAFIGAIETFIEDPEEWLRQSRAARNAADSFTYDHYLNEVRGLFSRRWGLSL